MLTRVTYFSGKAVGSIRESPGISALCAATVATALVVLGSYVMGLSNFEQLALIWGRAASVAAYVDDKVGEPSWEALRIEVARRQGIEGVALIRPHEALTRFKARGSEAAALVEGVSEDVLPAVLEIRLAPAFTDLAAIERLAVELRTIPGIADVDYGREEFVRLQGLIEILRYGGLIGGLLILLATAFIVSNTIRLAVYARRDEIGIQRLVGATAWFVRAPFVIEGSLWGLAGGLGAAGLLWLVNTFVAPRLSVAVGDVLGGIEIRLFAPEVAIGIVVIGVVLGAAGSVLAVRRFLEVDL